MYLIRTSKDVYVERDLKKAYEVYNAKKAGNLTVELYQLNRIPKVAAKLLKKSY